MKIIKRDVEFGNICQRVNTKNTICGLTTYEEKRISSTFQGLSKNGKEVSSIEDLILASKQVRVQELAKVRTLKKEESSGFILISVLTCVGTLITATIIFMTVKHIILG